MSKFFSQKYKSLVPYTPGEQPKDIKYIKLNTNESPFPPHNSVLKALEKEVLNLQLYPNPDYTELTTLLANRYNIENDEIILSNGSDEVLNFAFMAFCDNEHKAVFPNISYGFYSVFAEINCLPYSEISLKSDFTIDIKDYFNLSNSTIFIANPNAPTGIALTVEQIEEILQHNPNNVVVIDEAYVDFGAESCVPLIHKYDNLLVVQTFSKSRSMAGARLGFAIGNRELIRDLNTIKFSTNPYNINRLTNIAGIETIKNDNYNIQNCNTIINNREFLTKELNKLGFTMTDSKTNFIFAKHNNISGKELYLKLKQNGILVRHFDKIEITDYNRITIGTMEQMQILVDKIKTILEEQQ